MKPMERKFFRYIIRQLNYKELYVYSTNQIMLHCSTTNNIRFYANAFSNKYNVPYEQLIYYLSKWSYKGFYKWGITIDLGWFEHLEVLCGMENTDGYIEYANCKQYVDAVPERVKRFVNRELNIPLNN